MSPDEDRRAQTDRGVVEALVRAFERLHGTGAEVDQRVKSLGAQFDQLKETQQKQTAQLEELGGQWKTFKKIGYWVLGILGYGTVAGGPDLQTLIQKLLEILSQG